MKKVNFVVLAGFLFLGILGIVPVFGQEGCCCTYPPEQSPLWILDNETCSTYTNATLFDNATIDHDCRDFCKTVIQKKPEELAQVPNVTAPKIEMNKTVLEQENVLVEENKTVSEGNKTAQVSTVTPASDELPVENVASSSDDTKNNGKSSPQKKLAQTQPSNKPAETPIPEKSTQPSERADGSVQVRAQELPWLWISIAALGWLIAIIALIARRKKDEKQATKKPALVPAEKPKEATKPVPKQPGQQPLAQKAPASLSIVRLIKPQNAIRAPSNSMRPMAKTQIMKPARVPFVKLPSKQAVKEPLNAPTHPAQTNSPVPLPPTKPAELPQHILVEEKHDEPKPDAFAKLRQIAKK